MASPFGPCWLYDLASYGVTLPLWVSACAWLDFNLFLSTGCSLTAIQRKKILSQGFFSQRSFWNQWELKVDLCLQNPVIRKLLFSTQFCHPDHYVIFLLSGFAKPLSLPLPSPLINSWESSVQCTLKGSNDGRINFKEEDCKWRCERDKDKKGEEVQFCGHWCICGAVSLLQ